MQKEFENFAFKVDELSKNPEHFNQLNDIYTKKFYGYDLKKIKILTFIIYLNMIPLHEKPFDLFLFYFAKKLIGNIYE